MRDGGGEAIAVYSMITYIATVCVLSIETVLCIEVLKLTHAHADRRNIIHILLFDS